MVTLPLPGPTTLHPNDLDARLRSFFRDVLGDAGPDTFLAARAAVRRRAQEVRRRRRRVRHALGSTTLAAGMTAGTVQLWFDGRSGGAPPAEATGGTSAADGALTGTTTVTPAPETPPPDPPVPPRQHGPPAPAGRGTAGSAPIAPRPTPAPCTPRAAFTCTRRRPSTASTATAARTRSRGSRARPWPGPERWPATPCRTARRGWTQTIRRCGRRRPPGSGTATCCGSRPRRAAPGTAA